MKKYTWIFALLCAMALVFAVSCGDPGEDPPPIKFEPNEIFKDGKFNPDANADEMWGFTPSGKNILADSTAGMNFNGEEGLDITGLDYTKLILVSTTDAAIEGQLWPDGDDVIVKGDSSNWGGLNSSWNGILVFPIPDGTSFIFGFMFDAFGSDVTEITISKIYFE